MFGHVRFDLTRGPVIPFVYAGLGWAHYNVNALGSSGTSDRLVIPGGVGLEFLARPLVLGVRAEYQWNTQEIKSQHVDYWKAVGTVGVRF